MPLPSVFSSPIIGGGIILMLSGGVLALFRKIPQQIFEWVKHQVTISVEVTNSDPSFTWLTVWLNEHPYTKKARRLTVSTQKRTSKGDDDSPIGIIFSPSPGNHFLSYKKRWVWLSRSRKDGQSGGAAPSSPLLSLRQPEQFTLTMLGRNQRILRELLQETYVLMLEQQSQATTVYVHTYSYWSRLKGFEPRPLVSVILPGDEVGEILADIREFLATHDWYYERGIPYRRGYLFSGIHGSGKTSLIMGLSDELKLNIYVLSLGSKTLSDDTLPGLMLDVPPRSLILMEDIDAVVPDREMAEAAAATAQQPSTQADKAAEKPKGVSLSCLLNCLDGVVAGNGSIVFMTSNHPERLDPALIRPGRVDVRKEFGYVQPEQAEKLFRRFYPEADMLLQERIALAVKQVNITMADLQQTFLANKFDPDRAVAETESLLFVSVASE